MFESVSQNLAQAHTFVNLKQYFDMWKVFSLHGQMQRHTVVFFDVKNSDQIKLEYLNITTLYTALHALFLKIQDNLVTLSPFSHGILDL